MRSFAVPSELAGGTSLPSPGVLGPSVAPAMRDFGSRAAVLADSAVDGFVGEIRSAVVSLMNARAGGRSLAAPPSTTPCSSSLASAEQRWRDQVAELGPAPAKHLFPELLRSLLRSTDVYALDDTCTRRPLTLDKLRVAKDGGVNPKLIRDVCGLASAPVVRDPLAYICKDDAELNKMSEEDVPGPYSDPALRSPRTMATLVRRLFDAGVLGFRRRARSFVGLFTVAKPGKDELRLVVDARAANALHRDPPHSDLPTAGAFSSLDWSLSRLCASGAAVPLNITIAQLYLVDSFYQFAFEEVASFFCLDHRVTAR